MKYQRFEELPEWNAAIDLADRAYHFCDDDSFRFQADLRKQFTRAALSISNNIAEGFQRHTTKELINFLYIARGSAGEVRSMLYVIERNAKYAHLGPERTKLLELVNSIGKQLNAWIDSLHRGPTKSVR